MILQILITSVGTLSAALVACYAVRSSEFLNDAYSGCKGLVQLVKEQQENKSTLRAIATTIKILLQAVIAKLRLISDIKSLDDRRTYELQYSVKGRQYKMLMKPSRKPHPVLRVVNDKGHDVTDIIIPYMGPNHDWHYVEFTPKFFNEDVLVFELHEGTLKEFKVDDIISL